MKSHLLPILLAALSLAGTTAGNAGAKPSGELPSQAIYPGGWLNEFLKRQAAGLTGHPAESGFPFNRGMWADSLNVKEREFSQNGSDWWPYEQTAYYLDGALRAAYLLEDKDLLASVRKSIDAVLANPKPDGRLGTRNVNNDAWPMVILIRMLIEEYENSRDPKLLAAIERHYSVLYPEQDKLPEMKVSGFEQRLVLHVENLCNLARLTGKKEYADKAEQLYARFCAANPNDSKTADNMRKGVVSYEHSVSFHEFLKLPAVLYMATGKPEYLEAAEKGLAMLEQNHELADGLSSSHESLSGKESDNVHETCTAIDFIWTCGYILEATGDGKYADKMEKVLFNAGFGSIAKDFKSHQYYSGPNQVILSDASSHWNLDAGWGADAIGRMAYRPGHDTECCSGNIHRLVPAFVKRMWLVDDQAPSVTAALYAPSKVVVPFAGNPVTITETTRYPFENKMEFTFAMRAPKTFAFRLRIPGWSTAHAIRLNGQPISAEVGKDSFATIRREFANGDKLELVLATAPRIIPTPGGAAINYGPLVFSLPIKAEVKKNGSWVKSSAAFPAYELFPVSDWNFGLSQTVTANDVQVVETASDAYPWDEHASPLRLRVNAKRIGNWAIGEKPYTPAFPKEPTATGEERVIELEPMGTTLLRVTNFPLVK
jgi:hypothetical protein